MNLPASSFRRAIRVRGGRLTAAAVLPVALLAAGCGSGRQQSQVASLHPATHAQSPSGGGRGAAHADAGIPDPGGRPRQTLDMTSQQIATMFTPFDNCLTTHVKLPKGSPGFIRAMSDAIQTCTRYQPLPAWPLDPANPQSRAYIGRVVTCLRDEGYDARAAFTTRQDIGARQWIVDYTPPIVGIRLRTEDAQDACQERALR